MGGQEEGEAERRAVTQVGLQELSGWSCLELWKEIRRGRFMECAWEGECW